MTSTTASRLGIAAVWLATVVSVTLKLTGSVGWPWLWALAPLWGFGLLVMAIAGAAVAYIAVTEG